MVRLATQVAPFDLAALGADCRCLRTFGNLTTAWGTFHKPTSGTLRLVRLAAQRAALYLAATGAKLNTACNGRAGFAAWLVGFLAAVDAQEHPGQDYCHCNYQTFLPCFHN